MRRPGRPGSPPAARRARSRRWPPRSSRRTRTRALIGGQLQRSPDAHAAPRPYGSGDESVRWMWRAAGGALAGVLVPLLIVHYGWGARALIEAFTACVLLALATVDLE